MHEHNLKMKSKKLTAKMLANYDAVLISTNHSAYDCRSIVDNSQLLIDTRNATKGIRCGRGKIVQA